MSFIHSLIENSKKNKHSICYDKYHDPNIKLLMYKSTENPLDHDQIIIHNSSYNINPYLQLLIYTQNIEINPFNNELHHYNLKALIHHPSIDPFNKQFLIDHYQLRR